MAGYIFAIFYFSILIGLFIYVSIGTFKLVNRKGQKRHSEEKLNRVIEIVKRS